MVINCAFIGFGKSTTRYHLPYVLNRKDSWHVAHIFRRHAKPEEQAPIYSHIHFTSDLDEVLNDPDVKLVVVCTHADSRLWFFMLYSICQSLKILSSSLSMVPALANSSVSA